MKIPHLTQSGSTRQLYVDGEPYLILSGELGNSSASNLAYWNSLWPKLKTTGLSIQQVMLYRYQ